jgi:hypothetical protein
MSAAKAFLKSCFKLKLLAFTILTDTKAAPDTARLPLATIANDGGGPESINVSWTYRSYAVTIQYQEPVAAPLDGEASTTFQFDAQHLGIPVDPEQGIRGLLLEPVEQGAVDQ